MKFPFNFAVTALLILLGAEVRANPISEAEELLKLQQHLQAEAKLDDAAIEQAKQPEYARYLRATARFHNKKYPASITDCEAIDKESDWYHKAIFLKAKNLIEQKQPEPLESLYRSQAERLLAVERKNDLAKLLIEFANELSEIPAGKDRIPKAQAENAIKLLAADIETSPEIAEQIIYQRIQVLRDHEDSSTQRILASCRTYLEKFDPEWEGLSSVGKAASKPAEQAGDNLWPVRIILLETLLKAGRDNGEMRRYAQSIQKGSPNPGDIAWLIANSFTSRIVGAGGVAGNGLGPIQNASPIGLNPVTSSLRSGSRGNYIRTTQIKPLTTFLNDYPNHGRSAEASIMIARNKRGDEAIQAYRDFLSRQDWPTPTLDRGDRTDPTAKLREWQEQAAYQIGQIHFDRGEYQEAIKQWQAYSQQFANGQFWKAAQSQMVTAEYSAVLESIAKEDEAESRKGIEAFAASHPLDSRLPKLLYYLGEFPYVEATQLMEDDAAESADKYKPLFERAISEWSNLIAKYPDTAEAGQARYRTAIIQADVFGDFEKAVNGLENLKGSYEALAKQRLSLLKVSEALPPTVLN